MTLKTKVFTGLGMGMLLVAFVAEAGVKIPVTRTGQPPEIDGRLTDACWKESVPLSNFIVTLPVDKAGSLPEEKTEAFLLYDDSYLYLGARCQDDDVEKLFTSICSKRDGGWGDDCIEIFLNPNQTKSRYYQIIINAKGIICDLRYPYLIGARRKEGSDGLLWDSNCDAKTYIAETGWSLEARIPFAELELSPETTNTWGFNLTRWQARKTTNQSLVPLPGGSNLQLDKFGTLSGLNLNYDQYFCRGEEFYWGALSPGDNILSFTLENLSSLSRKAKVTAEISYDTPLTLGNPPYSSRSFILKPHEKKKVTLDYPVKEKGKDAKIVLKITDEKTGKVSFLKTKYFSSPASILELEMAQTDYYLSEREANLSARINVGDKNLKESSLFLTVLKDGKVISEKKVDSLSREITVPFSIAGLRPGSYVVSVKLRDKKKGIISMKDVTFNRIKGPFDEDM